MRIEAASPEELLKALKGSGQSVPYRGCGRDKTHTEAWSTSRLLASIARTDLLEYPLACDTATNKPDLKLYLPGRSIGIEITEMVPENYAQAVAIANREFDVAFIEPGLFPWGAPKLTGAEIRAMLSRMQTEFTASPSVGDAPAYEWATAVRDTLLTKLKKINFPEYMEFPDYWLATYDNLPLSGLNRKIAANLARPLIDALPSFPRKFSWLLVESGSTLICLGVGHPTVMHLPLKEPS